MRTSALLRAIALVAFSWPVLSQTLPEGPGKKELETMCGTCHGAEAVMGVAKMDRDGWQQKVFDMIGPGSSKEQAAIKAIVDYLVANFSPPGAKPSAASKVNANQASAKELESALSLSPTAADALVKYRQTNGKFNNLADLEKALAAIPAKIADDKKDGLAF